MKLEKTFADFASAISRACGHPIAFVTCVVLVLGWAVSGPAFGFSETWQLVINTGTTIITFLMVFLIQNTQNRDSAAVQAKLDELILTSKADNQYIGIEKMTDAELHALQESCAQAAKKQQALSDKAADEMKSRRGGSRPAPGRTARSTGAAKRKTG